MSIRRASMLLLICATVTAGILISLPSDAPAQEEGDQFSVAIPSSVTITVDQHLVIVTGKSANISPVLCAPGTPFPHSVVIVDQRGNGPAQHSEITIFGTDAVANGTRLRITGGGTTCNSQLKLYTGTVE